MKQNLILVCVILRRDVRDTDTIFPFIVGGDQLQINSSDREFCLGGGVLGHTQEVNLLGDPLNT